MCYSILVYKRTYKFRAYPTAAQTRLLDWQLTRCRELYNSALQERRDAYKMCGKSVSYYDQANQLPAIKEVRPEYSDIYSQVLQDVLRRADKAFQNFFRRVKQGKTPGYPRFQGRGRYDSITYPQSGWSLQNDRLTLSKIGTLKVRLHREMLGKVKTVSIVREGQRWFVCFSVEVEAEPLPMSDEAVGVDMGLNYFASLSNGERFTNPRYLRKSLTKLATKQQALARCQRGSHRRNQAKQAVATIHRKVANQRADFAHKLSRQLVNRYGMIVFEDLKPANMVKNHSLAFSISDVSWSQFQEFTSYKAESAGRVVIFVNPAHTSQTCYGCGAVKKKELDQRWHSCPCGEERDRDEEAAKVILRLGSSQRDNLRI
ncbi:MAG: transposase [Candidatus Chloroheliales bacterium]|nr:MAG: transposase [Chloroflexota bacterium]